MFETQLFKIMKITDSQRNRTFRLFLGNCIGKSLPPARLIMKRLFATLSLFVVSLTSAWSQAPESMMVMEAYSGKILVASQSTKVRPIASLNKIAVACVAVDWADAAGVDIGQEMATVPASIQAVGGPNPMGLQAGDRISLRDALNSALLGSDNLAAQTIADHIGRKMIERKGGGEDPVKAFVTEMNHLAQGLGMRKTRFVTPHGLEPAGSKGGSTAADVARLSVYAMRRPAITFIVRHTERKVSVRTPGGEEKSFLVKNTHELIGKDNVIGLKTGTTGASGPCLVTVVERDPVIGTNPQGQKTVTPRRLVVVLLGAEDRFNKTRSLIRQGWGIYDNWAAGGFQNQDPEREILNVPTLR